jgi:serine/threonine protein phosphatase PrpC
MNKRAANEDSMLVADLSTATAAMSANMNGYLPDRRGILMAVSDGMGGAVAREVASHIAVTVLHDVLRKQAASSSSPENRCQFPRPVLLDPGMTSITNYG